MKKDNIFLTVRNMSFAYREEEVLKNINFNASSGDFICVLGQNGAGKSTLFKCILGLLKGYKGSILINNEDIRLIKRQKLSQNIAYIPQTHYPMFNYSVMETVLMGFAASINLFDSPGKEHIKKAEKALCKLGIEKLKNRGYAYLSGGERQMVLIARAIVRDSKILIMDEPTANLDYGNQLRVMQGIKEISKSGYIVLMSTHNPEQAFFYSDKVLVITKGDSNKFGLAKQILTEDEIEKIYGVPVKLYEVGESSLKSTVCVANLNYM